MDQLNDSKLQYLGQQALKIMELEKAVKELEARCYQRDTLNYSLNAQNNDLNAQNNDLNAQNNHLKATVYTVKAQNNSLSDRLEQQESLLKEHGATIYLKIKNNRIY